MGDRGAVQVGAVAVEAPAEGRVVGKVFRIGAVDKGQPQAGIGRIGLPEAVVAAEVGQPGIDPHAGPGGDDEGLCFSDNSGGFSKHWIPPVTTIVCSTWNRFVVIVANHDRRSR